MNDDERVLAQALPAEPNSLGKLAAQFGMVPLIDAVFELANQTRADLRNLLQKAAHSHLAMWQRLIKDIKAGEEDPSRHSIPGAAFRPNYHAAQGSKNFERELWTESFLRYVMAGEVLIRDVVMPAAEEESDQAPEPSSKRITHWRNEASDLAKRVGVPLDNRAEWLEFSRVYRLRNKEFAHGHKEATMQDAMEARRAFEGLLALFGEVFRASHGITVKALQDRALRLRSLVHGPHEIQWAITLRSKVEERIAKAKADFKALLQVHVPKNPAVIVERLAELGQSPDDSTFTSGFEEGLQESFDLLRSLWLVLSDADTIFEEVVDQIEAEVRPTRGWPS